jgi:hypothetical protein
VVQFELHHYPIPTMKTGIDFINDKTPPTDPDDD